MNRHVRRLSFLTELRHKLFHCATFWRWQPAFHCPRCKVSYRCYMDGHDCVCGLTDLCEACYLNHPEHTARMAEPIRIDSNLLPPNCTMELYRIPASDGPIQHVDIADGRLTVITENGTRTFPLRDGR